MTKRFSFFRNHWVGLILGAFYLYLAIHALSGNQGLVRWVDYKADISRKHDNLTQLTSEREALEFRADQLRREHINLDVLDQKSRQYLFVSHPNEVTIFLDPSH